MAVYFIQAGRNGPVKIGCSAAPEQRMYDLQNSNHERLYLLRTVDGGIPVETWFKHAFAALRIRGEWFCFHDAMLTLEPPMGWSRPPHFEPTALQQRHIDNERLIGPEDRRAARFGKAA